MMLKRPHGKVSFAQIADRTGQIQLFLQQDALGAAYEAFKGWDVGDIIGAGGVLFRTRTGELIGVAGQWLSWATSFVPGMMLRPTLNQLRALGVTLGLLHNVAARPTELGEPGDQASSRRSMHPAPAFRGDR